jgi:hypothetical protein
MTMPEYDQREAIRVHDAEIADIGVAVDGTEISILGNQDGLTSLAIRLLSLAQDDIGGENEIRLVSFYEPGSDPLEVIIRRK